MIVDYLSNAERYYSMNPNFAKAFEFLRGKDLADLPTGRHFIEGKTIFADVIRTDGRGQAGVSFESHAKIIDIQFTLSGTDLVAWKLASDCTADDKGYNAEKDRFGYIDKPDAWVTTPAGSFSVFFPGEAHAPLGGSGKLHKVVVKVVTD